MSTQNFGEKVALPYAEALIANAKNADSLNKYKADLSSILSVLSSSKELQDFLLNPLNNNINKKSVLKKLFDGQVNSFIMNFLLVLVDRRLNA